MRVASNLDPILGDIVAAVRAYFSPTRVILFGSRARGDAKPDSDYDIMVETTRSCTVGQAWDSVRDVRDAHHVTVDVHTREPGELERRAPDPGWIDRAIVAEGVLLYRESSGLSHAQQESQARRVREERPAEWESVAGWLAEAMSDMTLIEHELAQAEPLWAIISYHAQQAAEKSLKAALVMRNRFPPRTHKLDELLAELIRAGAPLEALAEDCARLQPYFIRGRYPGTGRKADETEGRALVESARRVVAAVYAERGHAPIDSTRC